VSSRVFRLPRSAYLAVLFLALCVTPLVQHPLVAILYVIPVAGAVFIARTATIVDEDGIAVRALIGRRLLPWNEVRGLSVTGRSVYAVTDDGAVRLPCVRVSDLAALSGASGGHLPQLPEATPKYAPSRRRR
jgi:PH (Pleckstrin Homology) domain-containing protein